jgi:hypothetical protein
MIADQPTTGVPARLVGSCTADTPLPQCDCGKTGLSDNVCVHTTADIIGAKFTLAFSSVILWLFYDSENMRRSNG